MVEILVQGGQARSVMRHDCLHFVPEIELQSPSVYPLTFYPPSAHPRHTFNE